MNYQEAQEWLSRFRAFWLVRGRFWQLAWNTDGAGRCLEPPEAELRLGPERVRQCWAQALREEGNGLTPEAALELMKMEPSDRLAQLEIALNGLGLTAAGRRKFRTETLTAIESGVLELPGFWEFVTASIAGERRD